MSDNLGLNQTRVLVPDNKSFESVIYQRKKPPLSCEGNLEATLAASHSQDVMKWVAPSGWDVVGALKDDTLLTAISAQEALCYKGEVLTSPSYSYPTNYGGVFKLIGLDKGVMTSGLIAWVNGWKIFVQGTNSSDDNNIIWLSPPPSSGYSVDFVFLEVWRKLITPADTVIYKYGNVLYGGTNFSNDPAGDPSTSLIDPAIGIETSLRIQTQYRIRVVSAIDIINNPEGFDPTKVFVQGPLSEPIDSCDQAYFSPVPGDPGLWRAGAGDSAAQETLDTVDGYTYAIPMFAITRRNTNNYDPQSANGAGRNRVAYLAGIPSDRPDDKYSDWIVSSDILDLRHRISPTENLKEICENAFDNLIKGKAQNVMAVDTLGEDHAGKVLTQVDGVTAGYGPTWWTYLGEMGTNLPDGYRRVWSNATYTQTMSLRTFTVFEKVPSPGSDWANADTITISLSPPYYPSGTVFGSDLNSYRAWMNGPGSDLTPLDISSDITILGNGTNTLTLVMNSTFPSPPFNPLIDPPYGPNSNTFTLEYSIVYPSGPNGLSAVPDTFQECRKTLGQNVDSSSIATTDMDIRVRDISSGPVVTSNGTFFNTLANKGAEYTPYDFGHQMIYHAVGNGTSVITFNRNLFGYDVLGVARSKVSLSDVNPTSVVRTLSQYTVTFPSVIPVGADVELWLYTGVKFFETNKQGRGVIDTLEMKELSTVGDGINSSFTVDATGQPGISEPILAIASNLSLNGVGYAYVNSVQTSMSSWVKNLLLPTDETKSRVTIEFDSIPANGATISVPVLMKSAIRDNNEGYAFFYQKTPYQGLLNGSWATGVIETSGPAVTTTMGSGAIDSSSGIIRNVIDRLPAEKSLNDSSALNEYIAFASSEANPILNTSVVTEIQDIVGLPANAVEIGVQPTSGGRGRSRVEMPEEYAPLGSNNLGVRYSQISGLNPPNYQKTFQSYILNKDESGNLYMVVVGSESGNDSTKCYLNHMNNNDSVDIFHLPGRPLTNRIL